MRVAVAYCLLLGAPAVAGVFSPAEPCPFEVVNGVAKPLPHSRFKSLLNELRFISNGTLPEFDEIDTPNGKQRIPTPRGRTLARVGEMAARRAQLTPDERLTHSADLIRLGQTLGQHFAELKSVTKALPADYRLEANYAHAQTSSGDWSGTQRMFDDNVFELGPPTAMSGMNSDQLKWVLAVEKGAYRKWLRAREVDSRRTPGTEIDLYPLFPGVTFTGTELPSAVKEKLPADAVAVVQQLALWSPTDNGLLWLLAELYAAHGQLREADDTFFMCTWGAGLTGKKLMEHRRIVKSAVDKLPPPAPEVLTPTATGNPDPGPDGGFFDVFDPNKLWLIGGGFGLIVVALLALQVRAIIRRQGRRVG